MVQVQTSRYYQPFFFSLGYILLSLIILLIFSWLILLQGTTGVSLDLSRKGLFVSSLKNRDSGLQAGDIIQEVNSIAYEKMLMSMKDSPLVSEPKFQIRATREGKPVFLILSSRPILVSDLISQAFSFYLVILVLTGLSLAILFRAPPGQPSHIFLFSMISFSLATMADLPLSLGIIQPGFMAWIIILTLASGWMAFSSWTHFALRYPRQRDFLFGRPGMIALIYIVPPLISVLLAWMAGEPEKAFFSNLCRYRNWAVPILIPVTFIKHLSDILKSGDSLIRKQLLPAMIVAVAGISPYLFLHALPGIIIDRPLISSSLVSLMAMSIPLTLFFSLVRYRLFDIDRIVSKIISYIALITFLSLSYSLFLAILKRWFFGRAILSEELFILFIISTALIFQPVIKWIENRIDTLFFRHRRVPAEVLHDFSEKLTASLRRSDLVESIIHRLPELIQISKTALILVDGHRQSIFPPDILTDANNWSGSRIFDAFRNPGHPYFKTQTPEEDPLLNDELAMIFESGFAMVFPLKSTLSQPGMLLVGSRKDGRFFNKEDIHLFSSFANQTAIALENAIRYETLMESRKQLEALFNQKVQREKMTIVGELSTMLAHELKNPLGIIHSSAQYIEKGKAPDSVKKEMLHYIMDEVEHLSETISILLNMAKQRAPVFEAVNFKESLAKLIRRWCLTSRHNLQIRISRQVEDSVGEFYADWRQLTQVFHNLIENSEDMMPNGGEIRVFAARKEDTIRISVEDTGPGIKDEQKDKVFNSFFTTKEKGLGLGLVVCKQIVSAHNGTICLENGTLSGVRIEICLPVKPLATGATLGLKMEKYPLSTG
jgi:signal transduction histidine kinase